jgi:hypothetical protein
MFRAEGESRIKRQQIVRGTSWLPRIAFCIATALSFSTAYAQPSPTPWRWDDATPLERKAYSCSAMLLILTSDVSTPEFKRLSQIATAGGIVIGPVGGSQTSKRLNIKVTNGYLFSVRDNEIKTLSALWLADQAKFKAQAWECFSWVTAISQEVKSGKLKNPSEVTLPSSFPAISSTQTEFDTWVTAAVAAWHKMGQVTPSEVKELLRRSL